MLPNNLNPNEYPDFWEQMKNFTSFLKDVGQSTDKEHGIFVSEETYNSRMEVCKSCEQFDQKQKRCYMCGCFMENKMKFTSAKCPAKKW